MIWGGVADCGRKIQNTQHTRLL